MAAVLSFLLAGAAAGFLAGLLGIGGGLILVVALVWLLPLVGFSPLHVMHVALASALASIVFTAISSAAAHARRGSIIWSSVLALAPGLLLGSAAGALLATHLSGTALRWFVASFCLLTAWRMIAGSRRPDAGADYPRAAPLVLSLWGVLIGVVSAIVGIGGGSLTVPLLVGYGVRAVRAVGTSAACGLLIALAAVAGYGFGGREVTGLPDGSWGYIYLPGVLSIAVASVLTAPLGVRVAHAIPGRTLQLVFAAFLILMGVAIVAKG